MRFSGPGRRRRRGPGRICTRRRPPPLMECRAAPGGRGGCGPRSALCCAFHPFWSTAPHGVSCSEIPVLKDPDPASSDPVGRRGRKSTVGLSCARPWPVSDAAAGGRSAVHVRKRTAASGARSAEVDAAVPEPRPPVVFLVGPLRGEIRLLTRFTGFCVSLFQKRDRVLFKRDGSGSPPVYPADGPPYGELRAFRGARESMSRFVIQSAECPTWAIAVRWAVPTVGAL